MLYPHSMPVSVSPSYIRFTSNRVMGDLTDTIKAVLTALHTPLWFPDLTATLVDMGWQTLHRHTGITILDYGTARVLDSNARAPRHVVACLSFHPGADSVTPHVL